MFASRILIDLEVRVVSLLSVWGLAPFHGIVIRTRKGNLPLFFDFDVGKILQLNNATEDTAVLRQAPGTFRLL